MLPQNVLPASLPLSLPLSTNPEKFCSVKPLAVATGASDDWSPAHTQPQQNPLKLPSAVSQHGTQEMNCSSAFTAHGPVLPALPLGQEPMAASSGESHAAEQSSLCREGRAPWFLPSPQAASVLQTPLPPKRQPHQACKGSSNSKRKVCLLSSLKAPFALSFSFKNVPVFTY